MPVSSPFFSSRALFVVGTSALLVLLIVAITGGFVIDAGPLYLSVRSWIRPLVVAIAALLLAGQARPTRLAALAAEIQPFISRHATAIAIVVASSAAGAGIAHGTYAASGADAAGYVGQAALFASGRLDFDEPLVREIDWPGAQTSLTPLGYQPGTSTEQIVPGYPPGLPLVIALAVPAGPLAPFVVVPLLGGLAVLCTYFVGSRLHSTTAGVVAAALLATSPIFLFQVSQPMSDVPATAWFALALAFAIGSARGAPLLSGLAAGLAVLTRPNLLPLVLPLLVTLLWLRQMPRDRRRIELLSMLQFGVGLTTTLAVLLWINAVRFGSAFTSGYPVADLFALSFIPENLRLYLERILASELPALCLIAASLAIIVIAPRGPARTTGPGGISLRRAVVLGLLWSGATLLLYLPYRPFPDWYYLRFLLPGFPAAFVLVGAVAAHAAAQLPASGRGPVLLTAITIACAFNVVLARGHGAFLVRWSEGRFQIAGQYVEAMAPDNAVVISGQQSGSIRHYTGLPVVRWDALTIEPEAVIARLHERGRHPVLVLEAWEEPLFRARFPMSNIARLDWPPVADIGEHVRVRVYDPSQRGATGRSPRVDRVRVP